MRLVVHESADGTPARWDAILCDLDGTLWRADATYQVATQGIWDGQVPVADAATAARLDEAGWTRMMTTAAAHTRVHWPVVEFIRRSRFVGARTACVTNLPRWVGQPLLEALRLDGEFEIGVFNDEGSYPKPHPQPILRALAHFTSCEPARTLLVGDSDDDRQAARAAGVRFAAVSVDSQGVVCGELEPKIDQ